MKRNQHNSTRKRQTNKQFSNRLERELQSHIVSLPAAPVTIPTAPPVRRWVRNLSSYTGSTLAIAVSPSMVSSIDAANYTGSTTPVRYTQVRFLQCRAWLGLFDSGSSATPPAAGYPSLEMLDPATSFQTNDMVSPGVDFAKSAMVPCLQSRQSWLSATASTSVFTVTATAATGTAGQLIIDALVEFN